MLSYAFSIGAGYAYLARDFGVPGYVWLEKKDLRALRDIIGEEHITHLRLE